MAAKKKKTGTAKKSTAKKSTAKKGTAKKGTAKKRAAKKRAVRRERIDLQAASAATQARVFRALSAALRKAGVVGRLTRIEVEGTVAAGRTARSMAAPAGAGRDFAGRDFAARGGPAAAARCPDGFVLRFICEVRDGTVECEERCVPE